MTRTRLSSLSKDVILFELIDPGGEIGTWKVLQSADATRARMSSLHQLYTIISFDLAGSILLHFLWSFSLDLLVFGVISVWQK